MVTLSDKQKTFLIKIKQDEYLWNELLEHAHRAAIRVAFMEGGYVEGETVQRRLNEISELYRKYFKDEINEETT